MTTILRVGLQGSLPSGEKWSVNPTYQASLTGAAPTAEELAPLATAINAIAPPTSLRQLWNASTSLIGVRIEARDLASGDLQSLAEATRGTPVTGAGSAVHPGQTSVVTSLRTSQSGPRHRGRLFWPATGVGLEAATLRIAFGDVVATLNAMKTYLTDIGAAVKVTFPAGGNLLVWSRANAQVAIVNKLQLGDVVDTQRRRRDTLREAYQTVTFG